MLSALLSLPNMVHLVNKKKKKKGKCAPYLLSKQSVEKRAFIAVFFLKRGFPQSVP